MEEKEKNNTNDVKSIFLTQLINEKNQKGKNEKDEELTLEEIENLCMGVNDGETKFDETAIKLLENSRHTLQKTLVIRKTVYLNKMTIALKMKRQEYLKRMEACKKKNIELMKITSQLNERKLKFQSFIDTIKFKQQRALDKYNSEKRDYNTCVSEIASIQIKKCTFEEKLIKLKNFISRFKIYENYLLQVAALFPANYTDDHSESNLNSLRLRFKTILDTNKDLEESIEVNYSNFEKEKKLKECYRQAHQETAMKLNIEKNNLEKLLEKTEMKNSRMERFRQVNLDKEYRMRTRLGKINMSIINIYSMCKINQKIFYNSQDTISSVENIKSKLKFIQQFIKSRSDIIFIVLSKINPDKITLSARNFLIENNKDEILHFNTKKNKQKIRIKMERTFQDGLMNPFNYTSIPLDQFNPAKFKKTRMYKHDSVGNCSVPELVQLTNDKPEIYPSILHMVQTVQKICRP
ncbi:hypothetical protein A3Q56_06266, partial [Intoshia linei]